MTRNQMPVFYKDWEALAAEKLERGAFEYIRGGSGSGETLLANETAFRQWAIIPRVLRDVSSVEISTSILNQPIQAPILLAPVGYQKLACPQGELAAAKATEKAGVPYIASTVSDYSLEEISEHTPQGNNWFQLYWSTNEALTFSMVKRAEQAGYKAIVATVDTGVLGWRSSSFVHHFSPVRATRGGANFRKDPVFQALVTEWTEENIIKEIQNNKRRDHMTWDDILRLRKITSLPIILKGIQHPKDAEKAAELGFEGIIVSNHGGRQLDAAISSLESLSPIVDAVKDRIAIIVDGGIRSGTDVYKALALGADAVSIGRPYIYGLAAYGEEGVVQVIEQYKSQLISALRLSGEANMKHLSRENLHHSFTCSCNLRDT
ncbi:alpha-hydroxy acid oxidase [Paenibacillus sp. FSL L8-0158]|uniref:alpha-hydroxy acid oxidase n=1 Tax=Paenibacillus sp. FSL L8-0158 TaxID=2954752 RepID=UPI00315906BB